MVNLQVSAISIGALLPPEFSLIYAFCYVCTSIVVGTTSVDVNENRLMALSVWFSHSRSEDGMQDMML